MTKVAKSIHDPPKKGVQPKALHAYQMKHKKKNPNRVHAAKKAHRKTPKHRKDPARVRAGKKAAKTRAMDSGIVFM